MLLHGEVEDVLDHLWGDDALAIVGVVGLDAEVGVEPGALADVINAVGVGVGEIVGGAIGSDFGDDHGGDAVWVEALGQAKVEESVLGFEVVVDLDEMSGPGFLGEDVVEPSIEHGALLAGVLAENMNDEGVL